MVIHFRVVGLMKRMDELHLAMDVVPREGEVVEWRGVDEGVLVVRNVVWYPLGDPEEESQDPFVMVTVGPYRGGR